MQHLVAVVNHGRTMSNKNNGLVVVGKNVLQKSSFCLRIKCAGGLIEEHHTAFTQQRTGNGDTLSLSFG